MLILSLFAFLGGVVTILSPCVLPVLPVVLLGAVGSGRSRPWGIILGFIGSFSALTLTLHFFLQILHVSPDFLRILSVGFLGLVGVVYLIPRIQTWFEAGLSRWMRPKQGGPRSPSGFLAGLATGLSLGFVWTPCVGPVMGAVISLSATQGPTWDAAVLTLLYALGTALPMFLIMAGGRGLLRAPFLTRNLAKIQRGFGALILVVALVLALGWDRPFQTWFLGAFPTYGQGLTALESQEFLKPDLAALAGKNVADEEEESGEPGPLATPVPAPEFPDPEARWFRSSPLSLAQLRGHVVLLDFWTYSCVNCLRTLPYLKAWYEKYKDQGLVIIGVHTPEFAFEADPGNLEKAVRDLQIPYPVVQDNRYLMWRTYGAHFWPSKFFIDRQGRLRWFHFGEGKYEDSERYLQTLLSENGPVVIGPAAQDPQPPGPKTPETYLGAEKARNFASPEALVTGTQVDFHLPKELNLHQWALQGRWSVDDEFLQSTDGCGLELSWQGREVNLVMGAEASLIRLYADGQDLGVISVDRYRMYRLFQGSGTGLHRLKLEFQGKVQVYSFTFG